MAILSKKISNAIYVVDFYHVCEHLSTLSELFFKNHTDAQSWYKKYLTILKEDPNGVSKLIRGA